MIEKLTLDAELRAEDALRLPAFDGINLLGIKRQIAELLGLIGRGGIFDEYTKHDISHVDAAVKSLDWIIPDATKQVMTPTDWLLSVLALYFHDLGLLVTKKEYTKRGTSGFYEYRDHGLFVGDYGADYKARVEQLKPREAERFLYQEFVRAHHAARVRNWVMGRAPEHLGVTHDTMTLVDELLAPLNPRFRQDLALICESHHLDDLQDFGKYRVSQPYGNSDEETANVHYAALLLRMADLLHITSDRAPSVTFKAIDPVDPISQKEWAKQNAVLRVRPKIGINREGNPDENAPRDTIEVHAHFRQESGFFGLTAYLAYAGEQLAKSHQAARLAQRTQACRYEFPWRGIDDSQITTEDFIRETFEFTIAQARILDLLTGHTLYNDTSVVLRELAQNALDAVRLQHLIDLRSDPSATLGTVRIHWDSQRRILSVEDNGTGMTQEIIEQHLLKVGASRYQEEDFKRQYPDFSPASRFGIGILSTFMIADEVEVITSHPHEEEARQLSLRSVHGRYLIRLLDKSTDETAKRLSPHGTVVRIRVRRSARMPDIIESARRWVVMPRCELVAQIDQSEPARIGYDRLEDALEAELESCGEVARSDATGGRRIRIDGHEADGVALAYAVEWSEYFQDWSFVPVSFARERGPSLGTCVEGLRVETHTPGFAGQTIWAIANATGPDAPRTNVARTAIDATAGRAQMLRAIYTMLCNHVAAEITNLQHGCGFSVTRATEEAGYLMVPMVRPFREDPALDRTLLTEAARELPLFVVEDDDGRRAWSAAALSELPHFWSVHSELTRSAEAVIREASGPVSLMALLQGLGTGTDMLPPRPLLCGIETSPWRHEYVFSEREVGEIDVGRERRRVDLKWVRVTDPPRWQLIHPRIGWGQSADSIRYRMLLRTRMLSRQMLGLRDIEVNGLADEIAVRTIGTMFYVPGTPVADYLTRLMLESERGREASSWFEFVALVFGVLCESRWAVPQTLGELRQLVAEHFQQSAMELLDFGDTRELLEVLQARPLKIFDESLWRRQSE